MVKKGRISSLNLCCTNSNLKMVRKKLTENEKAIMEIVVKMSDEELEKLILTLMIYTNFKEKLVPIEDYEDVMKELHT